MPMNPNAEEHSRLTDAESNLIRLHKDLISIESITGNDLMDTVGPYIPHSRSSDGEENMICGRGSTDAKGCMTSQILAVEELIAEYSIHEGDIGLLFVVGEETDGAGMKRASEVFQQDGITWESVIFGEPSEHKLVLGYKVALAFEIIAHGKDAHSSCPELGINAISILIKSLAEIDGIRLPGSGKLGETTTSIGMIQGGVALNVIPAAASASVLTRLAVMREVWKWNVVVISVL
ncbi:uncharacterized protein EAF01_006191 [Botrytis porri]|uniref:Peptidase M20 dimerisation domain-containing protein n=1 Tax=Botrytis porri TaxID=87229 RepID=A0A4Z1KRU7_9HELO|nr:uncharacterized protein EAF01_006191 [Botrytis porri]KAF7903142.1 hypothetical protein EAF01_006191 [Botrytis porri]TGO84935.1 hypothetical protein BPOR_0449g00060 [Botrytis porri]